MIKYIFLLLLICSCFLGCAQFSGGGDYKYERRNPATGETIKVTVHSARKVGAATIHFSPDGAVDVSVTSLQPGPNNLAQALGIIDSLVKTGASMSGL